MRKKLILIFILSCVMPLFAACSCGGVSGGAQSGNQGDTPPVSETPELPEQPEEPVVGFSVAYALGKACEADEGVLLAMKKSNGAYPTDYTQGVGCTVDELKNNYVDETYAYTFLGWYFDEECTLLCENGVIGADKTGDLTLYAKIERTALSDLAPDDDRNWTDSQ